jgi:hypothetical protein
MKSMRNDDICLDVSWDSRAQELLRLHEMLLSYPSLTSFASCYKLMTIIANLQVGTRIPPPKNGYILRWQQLALRIRPKSLFYRLDLSTRPAGNCSVEIDVEKLYD